MNIINNPTIHYTQLLINRQPFTFARYGDGEWLTILNFNRRRNSNGCTFTPQLSAALQQVLKYQSPYYHCILKIAKKERIIDNRQYGLSAISGWLEQNYITMDWYNGDVFLDDSLNGKFFPFIQAMREYRILYVGNERLRELNKAGFFDYTDYYQVPPLNAYDHRENILKGIMRIIDKKNIDFIGWSSGLAAKYFIEIVYQKYPHITQVDFGSMFDGYFEPLPHIKAKPKNNTGSRSYIRKGGYDWEMLKLQNTGRV